MEKQKEQQSTTNQKLKGYDFWKCKLNSAKYVVAPMVEQSELAWRMLSRQYGAHLCYTPMFHAGLFGSSDHYRNEMLQICEKDRPLIVQFCANDGDTLIRAAQLAEPHCDAIDLNLGCPQSIAKRGHYGAFLENEWDLLKDMVSKCHEQLSVPITCKIRIFSDIAKSVEYARMLEKAGCQLLTVHGRTKEMKGANTGLASWSHIKAIKESVRIPVFANGNIQYLSDVERCLRETGVDGVMSAEGNLHNPAIFTGRTLPTYQLAEEYLHYVRLYPCARSIVRGHLFKLFHHSLQIHTTLRDKLGAASSMDQFVEFTAEMKEQLMQDEAAAGETGSGGGSLPLPHWMCQPYVRPSPVGDGGGGGVGAGGAAVRDEEAVRRRANIKRQLEELSNNSLYTHLSRKKLRRMLRRHPDRILATTTSPAGEEGVDPSGARTDTRYHKYSYCTRCSNPRAAACSNTMCKPCCRRLGGRGSGSRECEVESHQCSTPPTRSALTSSAGDNT